MKPRDCDELLKSGNRLSGIHAVYVGPSQRPLLVYCDMETDGGGWTVCTLQHPSTTLLLSYWLSSFSVGLSYMLRFTFLSLNVHFTSVNAVNASDIIIIIAGVPLTGA